MAKIGSCHFPEGSRFLSSLRLATHDPAFLQYPPWNGRHLSAIGLEEVTSYFHEGLAESVRPNSLSRRGIPTSLRLRPDQPTVVDYIMAVAEIPAGFDEVRTIRPGGPGVVLTSASGRKVQAPLCLDFLQGESPT